MQGKIEADLAAMPFANMALLFGGIAILLIVFAVIVFVFVRKLGIKNIGPIKIEQHGQNTMHCMNGEADKEDEACRRQMRQATGGIKNRIASVFADMNICAIARVAISSAIRYPMYESVANNHFTSELMPDNYDAYRSRIVEMMKDEYISLSSASKSMRSREALPSWDDVSRQLSDCIDLWLKRISREVMLKCEKKKAIYLKYLPQFEAARDDYRIGIVKNCVEKNERYIAVLKARL